MDYKHYTNDDLDKGINIIARQLVLKRWRPDHIVGVLRGGIIPAVYLSHWFNCNMSAINWSTRDGKVVGDDGIKIAVNLLADNKKVLLVDDICDTGSTLEQIVDEISKKLTKSKREKMTKNNLKIACLHHNIGQDLYDPDFYQIEINKDEDPRWIKYPWER